MCPTPLVLDPSGCAYTWIEEYLKHHSIPYEITSQNADRFTYNLELAVRFGKCLIVQDCQSIRPPLLSIIFGIVHSRFNKKLLQVGNKLIDYHENFKLLLMTKMTDIEIGTEIGAYVTKIPFTTTVSGYTGASLKSKYFCFCRFNFGYTVRRSIDVENNSTEKTGT